MFDRSYALSFADLIFCIQFFRRILLLNFAFINALLGRQDFNDRFGRQFDKILSLFVDNSTLFCH